ncbi:MAG: deoxynucleoside kinase [Bacteroidales bacterium]|nr:deoxynucleoside kinase [Bacteroidales bacterium]
MYTAIAGNIGSGKTTLTELLVKNYGWTAVYEQPDDNPYIANFYDDMRRWSFNLQIYFLQKRYSHVISSWKTYKNIVQDRTIYEDAYIFAPNLHSMGLLSTTDYETYISLFNLLNSLAPTPDLLIYLKASVPTLINLIAKRGRIYENSIRLDYITSLNKRYDDWFNSYKGRKIIVDVDNLNIIDSPADLGEVLQKIDAEFNSLFQ